MVTAAYCHKWRAFYGVRRDIRVRKGAMGSLGVGGGIWRLGWLRVSGN